MQPPAPSDPPSFYTRLYGRQWFEGYAEERKQQLWLQHQRSVAYGARMQAERELIKRMYQAKREHEKSERNRLAAEKRLAEMQTLWDLVPQLEATLEARTLLYLRHPNTFLPDLEDLYLHVHEEATMLRVKQTATEALNEFAGNDPLLWSSQKFLDLLCPPRLYSQIRNGYFVVQRRFRQDWMCGIFFNLYREGEEDLFDSWVRLYFYNSTARTKTKLPLPFCKLIINRVELTIDESRYPDSHLMMDNMDSRARRDRKQAKERFKLLIPWARKQLAEFTRYHESTQGKIPAEIANEFPDECLAGKHTFTHNSQVPLPDYCYTRFAVMTFESPFVELRPREHGEQSEDVYDLGKYPSFFP